MCISWCANEMVLNVSKITRSEEPQTEGGQPEH